METNHIDYTRKTNTSERPDVLPELTADDFCKAKYSQQDKRCYTARLLDIFLDEKKPFVAAYKEFRLESMDYLYKHHKEDHASCAEDRAKGFNEVAKSLGYKLVTMEEYQAYWNSIPEKKLISTYCGSTIWSGFFGMNENGDHDECSHDIELFVEGDEIELDTNTNTWQLSYSTNCPKCNTTIEDHEWELVNS